MTSLSSVTSASAPALPHPTVAGATHQPAATTKIAVALPHHVAATAKTAMTTAAAPLHPVTTTTAAAATVATAPHPAIPRVVLRSRNLTPRPVAAAAATATANRTLTLLRLPDAVVVAAATTIRTVLPMGTIARLGGPRLLLGAMAGVAVGTRSARRGVTGDLPSLLLCLLLLSRIRSTCLPELLNHLRARWAGWIAYQLLSF